MTLIKIIGATILVILAAIIIVALLAGLATAIRNALTTPSERQRRAWSRSHGRYDPALDTEIYQRARRARGLIDSETLYSSHEDGDNDNR